jgi:hypothetical protein
MELLPSIWECLIAQRYLGHYSFVATRTSKDSFVRVLYRLSNAHIQFGHCIFMGCSEAFDCSNIIWTLSIMRSQLYFKFFQSSFKIDFVLVVTSIHS